MLINVTKIMCLLCNVYVNRVCACMCVTRRKTRLKYVHISNTFTHTHTQMRITGRCRKCVLKLYHPIDIAHVMPYAIFTQNQLKSDSISKNGHQRCKSAMWLFDELHF